MKYAMAICFTSERLDNNTMFNGLEKNNFKKILKVFINYPSMLNILSRCLFEFALVTIFISCSCCYILKVACV